MNKTLLTVSATLAFGAAELVQAAPIVVNGVSYRTRADSGVYNNTATSPNFAYGWADAAREWRAVWAFDLDADDDGVNDLAGPNNVVLESALGTVPGADDDDFELVFLGRQGPQTSSSFGPGTNYPFNTLFYKPPSDTDLVIGGTQTFVEALESGATTGSFDVDFLADFPVTATDNVVFFQIRSTADSFAEAGAGPRFSAAAPTLTATPIPEPGSLMLAGAGGLMLLARRRRA
ncbi:MAG: PEP-CTERM sorting domain-containing protein [Planctomycetota bacterium]